MMQTTTISRLSKCNQDGCHERAAFRRRHPSRHSVRLPASLPQEQPGQTSAAARFFRPNQQSLARSILVATSQMDSGLVGRVVVVAAVRIPLVTDYDVVAGSKRHK